MPAITKTINVTVTQTPPQGAETEPGYTIEVAPWLARPPAGDHINRIEWHFHANGGIEFSEASLDFGTADNFAGTTGVGGRYVLGKGQPINPPDSSFERSPQVKNPNAIPNTDFAYTIDLQILGGPRIVIDPGYRVWP